MKEPRYYRGSAPLDLPVSTVVQAVLALDKHVDMTAFEERCRANGLRVTVPAALINLVKDALHEATKGEQGRSTRGRASAENAAVRRLLDSDTCTQG